MSRISANYDAYVYVGVYIYERVLHLSEKKREKVFQKERLGKTVMALIHSFILFFFFVQWGKNNNNNNNYNFHSFSLKHKILKQKNSNILEHCQMVHNV